uniref:Uncharacterized protein n=1 Tax=Caenorhabditis japonica TaxID=281687 RepID=A0A8R1EGE3_CAEJA
MFNPAEIRCWSLLKYKQIKRDGREETQNVQLALDEPRKRLGVFTRGEELEQVYYNMEVMKYPVLRFKENNLYVIFNGQGQGFRLSFRPEDKANFVRIMRKQAYISESPAKNISTQADKVKEWAASGRGHAYSFSQPPSSREMLPPKYPAARNLSLSFSQDAFPDFSSPPTPSFSQSTFSRPESRTSSIGSTLGSLSQNSELKFRYSSQPCSSQLSNYSPSPIPFTPPTPAVQYTDKSVQTEGNFMEQLAADPQFLMNCMRKMMENQKFEMLVKSIREEIRKMSEEEKRRFCEKTDPSVSFSLPSTSQRRDTPTMPEGKKQQFHKTIPSALFSLPSTSQQYQPPSISHQNSDIEYDIFFDEENT